MAGPLLLLAVACTANAPSVPTRDGLAKQELDETKDYMAYTAPIIIAYSDTLVLALEAASIESSTRIFRSSEAAVDNLERLFQSRDEIEDHRSRFTLKHAPLSAWDFEELMLESFSSASNGIDILVGGYMKYAEDGGFPTREDVESFAKTRALAHSQLTEASDKWWEATKIAISFSKQNRTELDRLDSTLGGSLIPNGPTPGRESRDTTKEEWDVLNRWLAEFYGLPPVSNIEELRTTASVVSVKWFGVVAKAVKKLEDHGIDWGRTRDSCYLVHWYMRADARLYEVQTPIEFLAAEELLVKRLRMVDESADLLVERKLLGEPLGTFSTEEECVRGFVDRPTTP